MIIAVQGTKKFEDYETFMRAMGVALSQPNPDGLIEVWSAGPHKINSFTAAFCNSAENYLKQKGYKVIFRKVPTSYVQQNMADLAYLAYFSAKNEKVSPLVVEAELSNIEVGIYRD